MSDLPYTVERVNRSLLIVTIDIQSQVGFQQDFMLKTDDHWDNPKCKRDLLKRGLDEAKKRRAGVFGGGDLFCAMQGKYDKRSNKNDVREEHNNAQYLDSLVQTGVDWYSPYSDIMIAEGRGNHETAILKNHETDLTERLCSGISGKTGNQVHAMGYGYWVKFKLRRQTQTKSFLMYVYHGSGGGGPVTKGVIQTNRRAVYLPDADIVFGGHIHEGWCVYLKRMRVTKSDRIIHDTQAHVSGPTFKEEYSDGFGGWHIERGGPPKPLGFFWLRFYYQNDSFKYKLIPEIEHHRDVTVSD